MTGLKTVRCRQIEVADLPQVVDLLTEGFRAQRRRSFWDQAMRRLTDHRTPQAMPRFGYLLESEQRVVGVILLIFSSRQEGDAVVLRCNLSSWYVAPAFRPYAPMLISRALKHREATYLNLTPAPHTFPILQAQGFHRYCEGRFIALAAIAVAREPIAVQMFVERDDVLQGLRPEARMLLREHADYGCISVVCHAPDGAYPFVFAVRKKFGLLRLAVLAYSEEGTDFARFAGPLGRFLMVRGCWLVSIDAQGPIAGLLGWFDRTKPKYYRGSDAPRPGDAAYTERTMFGS